ncbi:MAG: hypothetical protein WC280_01500 [Patescibacteria group bacterium]
MIRVKSTLTDSYVIGIIANCISPQNRAELVQELGESKNGFFNPLEFSYKRFRGAVVPLDVMPHEIMTLDGTRKARKALLGAVESLVKNGARVICLAASTKRLAGKRGEILKKIYPNIIFTIGDSTTTLSLTRLIAHTLKDLKFNKKEDFIFCLGSGFLGNASVEYLLKNNYKNIIVLSEFQQNFPPSVRVVKTLEDVNRPIKLMLSCTHKYELPIGSLDFLEKGACIIDVAVPAGVGEPLFDSLKDEKGVKRFDGGDFYLKDIKYDFNPKLLNMPMKEVWYGCFAEAVLLTVIKNKGAILDDFDFFQVNERNKDFLSVFLKSEEAKIPLVNFYDGECKDFIKF